MVESTATTRKPVTINLSDRGAKDKLRAALADSPQDAETIEKASKAVELIKSITVGDPASTSDFQQYIPLGTITIHKLSVSVIGGIIDQCRGATTAEWGSASIARLVAQYKIWAAPKINPNFAMLTDNICVNRVNKIIADLVNRVGRVSIVINDKKALIKKTKPIIRELIERLYVSDEELINIQRVVNEAKAVNPPDTCFKWTPSTRSISMRRFVILLLGDVIDQYRGAKPSKMWLSMSTERLLYRYQKYICPDMNKPFQTMPMAVAMTYMNDILIQLSDRFYPELLSRSHVYFKQTAKQVTEALLKSLIEAGEDYQKMGTIPVCTDTQSATDAAVISSVDTTVTESVEQTDQVDTPVEQPISNYVMQVFARAIDLEYHRLLKDTINIGLLDESDFRLIVNAFERDTDEITQATPFNGDTGLDAWVSNIAKHFIRVMVKCKSESGVFRFTSN